MRKICFKSVSEFGYPKISFGGYVYIASLGPISKVGCTRNPKSRIENLEMSAGLKFSNVYFSQDHGGCFKSENKIHKILSEFNLCKEWFLLDANEIINMCSEVRVIKNLYPITVEMGLR